MPVKYDQETRARAIRLVREHAGDYPSEYAAITAVARRVAGHHTGPHGAHTTPDAAHTRAPDLVKRNFAAQRPGQLHVADFTYVPLDGGGFGYTALVIDAFAGLIAGWECSLPKETAFVERAIRQAAALRARQGHPISGAAIHHSDAGCQGRLKGSSQHSPVVDPFRGHHIGLPDQGRVSRAGPGGRPLAWPVASCRPGAAEAPGSRVLAHRAARDNAASLSVAAGRQPVPVTFGLRADSTRAGMAELL